MAVRNSFLISIFALLLFFSTGCSKSKFDLEFALNPDVWGNYQITYYASDGKRGQWINTTAPVQSGKFRMEGISRVPVVIVISNSMGGDMALYAEPGQTLKITGDDPNPAAWSADGNDVNATLSEWRRSALFLPKDSVAGAIAGFVGKNTDSPAAALLLLTSFPRYEYPSKFVSLWNSLGKGAKRVEMADISGLADFGPGAPFAMNASGNIRHDAPRRLVKSLALRRSGGYADTLRFDNSAPAFIWFYMRNDDNHLQMADTLKNLRRVRPDSLSNRLVTVSMDADSVKWNNAVAFDSIPKVLDAWMPLGSADRRAALLGVNETPFFIVIDKKGRQAYRGSDIAKASAQYRKLLLP